MLFFFDTDDGEHRVADSSGTELPNETEAVEQAVSLLRDLSHAGVAPGAARAFAVRVRGPGGEDLYAATLQLRIEQLG